MKTVMLNDSFILLFSDWKLNNLMSSGKYFTVTMVKIKDMLLLWQQEVSGNKVDGYSA